MKALILPVILTASQVLANVAAVPTALEAATKLVGEYTGTGFINGIDESGNTTDADGNPLRLASWEEQIVASNPHIDDLGRAVVDVVSTMNGPGWPEPFVTKFVEGYFVESDGTAGTRFFETPDEGVVHEFPNGENAFQWVQVFPVSQMPPEVFQKMGILIPYERLKAVKIVTDKVLTQKNGQELDTITKTMTVKFVVETTNLDGTVRRQLQTKTFNWITTEHRRR